MKALFAAISITAALAFPAATARADEATFTRDLTVTGTLDLTAMTGSGSIHLTACPAGHVHIFGRVKSNWNASGGHAHEIADNPPIEQTGNIVRIGVHRANLQNTGIDYEIQAPAGSYLHASSGSGNITDDGVGENAKISTGSGNIHATGLHGAFSLDTGSGDIYAEQVGDGDVKAETGSGNIELRNLRGGLRAQTGSGSIKVAGTPTSLWHLGTGSGNVELWTGNAAITLDAQSGSGGVHTDSAIAVQGSTSRHHVTGKINGGGPTVHIETGSGSIRIH